MVNAFTIKKMLAILLPPFLCVSTFIVMQIFYNFWYALAGFFVALGIGYVCGIMFLSNPFLLILEGKGMLAIDMNSTGVLTPFILKISPPIIKGKLAGENIITRFNRNIAFMFRPPVVGKTPVLIQECAGAERVTASNIAYKTAPKTPSLLKDPADQCGVVTELPNGGITITLDEESYNKGRFALFHFPVILYNRQLKTVITKDWFSNVEKEMFVEHNLMYIAQKLEELTSIVRDFGRYIVELTKPRGDSIFANKWFWIIVVGMIVVLGVLFAPYVIKMFQGGMSAGQSALNSASGASVDLNPVHT